MHGIDELRANEANDDSGDGGKVGAREGGCLRIRLRPLFPIPCSCSSIIGDLTRVSISDLSPSTENRILAAFCVSMTSPLGDLVFGMAGVSRVLSLPNYIS